MTLAVPDKRLYWLGLAAGAFSVVNFSLFIVVGRLGVVGQTLTVFDQAALRHAASALCALPILMRAWPWGLSLRQHVILASAGGAPYIFVLFSGMTFAPAAHAAIVMNGALPFMAALVSWLWLRQAPGRSPSPASWSSPPASC